MKLAARLEAAPFQSEVGDGIVGQLRLDMAAGQAALFQILLVVILGGIERDCGNDLGDDRL
jgi:hypothetical protein